VKDGGQPGGGSSGWPAADTGTPHGSSNARRPMLAARSSIWLFPVAWTRSGRHRPRGLTRLTFPAFRQRQLPVHFWIGHEGTEARFRVLILIDAGETNVTDSPSFCGALPARECLGRCPVNLTAAANFRVAR
jgi:hypothetical protein